MATSGDLATESQSNRAEVAEAVDELSIMTESAVTIYVGQLPHPAIYVVDKILLCTQSQFFDAVLNGSKTSIHLEDVDSAMFALIIHWIRNHVIPKTHLTSLASLFILADCLMIEDLRKAALKFFRMSFPEFPNADVATIIDQVYALEYESDLKRAMLEEVHSRLPTDPSMWWGIMPESMTRYIVEIVSEKLLKFEEGFPEFEEEILAIIGES